MQNYRNDLERMVYFAMNYPPNFIEKIWGGTWLEEHMKEEFEYLYETRGNVECFLYFYCSLDMSNREKMDEFIKNW